jgi:hypothetical protein
VVRIRILNHLQRAFSDIEKNDDKASIAQLKAISICGVMGVMGAWVQGDLCQKIYGI